MGATKNWKVSEYLEHFEETMQRSQEQRFKDALKELTGELSMLDAEFLAEGMGCNKNLDELLTAFHGIYGRLGYCEKPRGFEKECDALYTDVAAAVKLVHKFRDTCSI